MALKVKSEDRKIDLGTFLKSRVQTEPERCPAFLLLGVCPRALERDAHTKTSPSCSHQRCCLWKGWNCRRHAKTRTRWKVPCSGVPKSPCCGHLYPHPNVLPQRAHRLGPSPISSTSGDLDEKWKHMSIRALGSAKGMEGVGPPLV